MKLADLSPEHVAREVVGWVTDHVASLAISLGPGVDVQLLDRRGKKPAAVGPDSWRSTDLGLSVHALTLYARDGAELDAPLQEYLISLLPVWSCADPSGQTAPPPWEVPHDGTGPDRPLDVVCLAADARALIEHDASVPVRALAALASLSESRVRMLGSRGELAVSDGAVGAGEARRWLSGRGVPGI